MNTVRIFNKGTRKCKKDSIRNEDYNKWNENTLEGINSRLSDTKKKNA